MDRPTFLFRISETLQVHSVAALLGPRQCGKTTLARMYAERLTGVAVMHLDLEDPTDLAVLANLKRTPHG